MADWNTPVTTTGYAALLQALKDRDLDAATQFYAAAPTNPATNMIRFVSANNRWERYNGTAWVELSTALAIKLGSGSTINATPIGATTPSTGAFTTLTATTINGQTVTANTPAAGDNSTNVATTAWVLAKAYAPLASPTFTGTPAGPTASVDTNTTQLATTAFVVGQGYAKLASPALTGTPTAPTAATATNTTQIATTAFVKAQGYATLASPALTGTPTAPTAAAATNSTQIATTAFVKAQNYQAALGFTPVQQGGGIGQLANKVYIGWSGTRLKATIDTVDYGEIATVSDVNQRTAIDPGAGGVGSYALARLVSGTYTFGDTMAGSNLRPVDSQGSNSGNLLTGTWRQMGQANTLGTNAQATTLFLRIA